MKILKCILPFAILMICAGANAQTTLSMHDSTSTFVSDTVASGGDLIFVTEIINDSPDTACGGVIYLKRGVDTMGTGGLVPSNIDTISQVILTNVAIPAGSYMLYNDTINFVLHVNCKGGINTVVIWPINYWGPSVNFGTGDSLRHDFYVFDPVGLREVVQKDKIVVAPNPFSDKICIISDPKNPVERVRIWNTLGQCVFDGKVGLNQINTSGLPQGVYHVEVLFRSGNRSIIKTIKE